MNKIRVSFLIFILLTLSINCYAQPSTIIILIGGYSAPLGDMNGNFGDTQSTFTVNPDSNTYFLKYGFNFGLHVQYAPFKDKKFKFLGGINYNYFFQNRDYTDWENPVKINLNQQIITFSLGTEFQYLTRFSRVNPFGSIEFTTNLFSGSYTETYSQGDPSDFTLKSTVRFGIQLGAGVDIILGRRLGVVTGFKYNFANLLGKKSTGDFGKEYSLNDKEGQVGNTKYLTKSIQYLQLYAGFSLLLGI